jgi:hypothetical protein
LELKKSPSGQEADQPVEITKSIGRGEFGKRLKRPC